MPAFAAASLSAQAGDTITITPVGAPDFFELTTPGGTSVLSPTQILTVVDPGTYSISNFSEAISVNCAPTGAGANPAAALHAETVSTSMENSIGQASRERLGGGTATRSGVFMSTQNLPGAAGLLGAADYNAWVSFDWRSFSGGYTGHSADLVVGVDRLNTSRSLVGVLLAYGTVDIASGATTSLSRSPTAGAYFATRLQDRLYLNGYLAYGRPAYEVTGGSFTATRISSSLSLSGSMTRNGLAIEPFARLRGYREEQPAYGAVAANSVTSLKTSLGARFAPVEPFENGMLPSISLAADFGHLESTAGGVTSYTAPRVGLGLGMPLGRGYLSIDLDAGRVRSDVTDFGAKIGYEIRF